MAKKGRPRKKYTEEQRAQILAAAQKDKLTALQIQKRFGVTPVTYYSWRKKKGLTGRRRRGVRVAAAPAAGTDLAAQVRAGVQAKIRQILPVIVRNEVKGYLDSLFASGRRRRVRRRGRRKAK